MHRLYEIRSCCFCCWRITIYSTTETENLAKAMGKKEEKEKIYEKLSKKFKKPDEEPTTPQPKKKED